MYNIQLSSLCAIRSNHSRIRYYNNTRKYVVSVYCYYVIKVRVKKNIFISHHFGTAITSTQCCNWTDHLGRVQCRREHSRLILTFVSPTIIPLTLYSNTRRNINQKYLPISYGSLYASYLCKHNFKSSVVQIRFLQNHIQLTTRLGGLVIKTKSRHSCTTHILHTCFIFYRTVIIYYNIIAYVNVYNIIVTIIIHKRSMGICDWGAPTRLNRNAVVIPMHALRF